MFKVEIFSGGLGYRFTPAFEVTGGVYYIKDENNSANKSTEFVVGANYSLSKAITLYSIEPADGGPVGCI